MIKKVLVVGIVVVSIFIAGNYCWAAKRSLDSDKQINAFISLLKKDTERSPRFFEAMKKGLLDARENFNEASAIKFLSKAEDPNDPMHQDAQLCGGYLFTLTYLYYDDSAKLVKLYDNMSDYSKDTFIESFDRYLSQVPGEPFFEVSKKYLLDLASRWRTAKNTNSSKVRNGILLLTKSPKEKYVPVIKNMLKVEGVARMYPRTIVNYVCNENLPGMEEGVKSYFSNYEIDADEVPSIAHYLIGQQGANETFRFFVNHQIYYENKLKATLSARAIVKKYLQRGDAGDR